MSFTIPDVASAWNAIQARVQSGDFQILADGASGVGVLTGAAVTPQGSPDMTVAVASGTVRIGGSSVSVSSGNVTITANATGNPRLDLICVNGSGTKSAQAGTAAATPKYPTIPGSSVVLAAVLVPTGAASITANNIVDKRVTVATTTGLLAANNLSDLASATSARTNLGLGTMATQAASAVAITGGTITGIGSPSGASDVAIKSYVDALTGSSVATKLPVKAATTVNISLGSAQVIDGVSVVAGDRVLVKNQTTGANNGIYVVASGPWSRAADSDSDAEMVSGVSMFVTSGVQGGRTWYLSTADPIVVGTTALTFAQQNYPIGTAANTVAAGNDSRFDFSTSVTSTVSDKVPVRVATTANITLSGTQTIDGVAVIAGDRVLVKNQTTGANNGIYVVASGAWSRATDFDTSADVTAGLTVVVVEGSTNGGKVWLLTTSGAITLGVTSLAFTAIANPTPAVTNVRIAGNLVGDGTTNDAVGLQAVIDASLPGDTLFFDRIFGVGATIKFLEGRKYMGSSKDTCGFRQINGSNLDYVLVDAGWYNNDTTASLPYTMEDIRVDVNKTGQSSGTGIGLICMNFWAVHRSCEFMDYQDAGVKLSTQNRAGTTISDQLSEPRFWECQFRGNGTGQGIWQYDPSLAKCADGWVIGCAFAGGQRGVYLAGGAAGWVIVGNHFYAQRKDAIYGVGAYATTVTGNYIEGWGYDNSTVVEKWAIGLEFANGPWPSTITGNVCTGPGPGIGTQLGYARAIQYYGVSGAAAKCTISGNSCFGISDGTSSAGIWVSSQGGGGTVLCGDLASNMVTGFTTPLVTDSSATFTSFPDGGPYYVGTFASTYTPNLINGNTQQVTLTGNITIAAPTNTFTGARLTFVFVQDATGTRTVSLNSVFKKAGGAYTASTGNGAKSTIGFVFDGTNWNEVTRALALA